MTWRSAAELARLRLPRLPKSAFGIREYAKRNRWKSRTVKGRGGHRIEFSIENLSALQLDALAEHERANGVAESGVAPVTAVPAIYCVDREAIDEAIARFERASDSQRARAENLAAALEAFHYAPRGKRGSECAAAARAVSLRPSSIRDHYTKVKNIERGLWPAFLIFPRRRRRNFFADHPEISDFCAAVILERLAHVSDSAVAELARAHFMLSATKLPALRRWCREFRRRNRAELAIAVHPDLARGRFMPAHGRMDDGVSDFGEVVEMDGSPSDVFTRGGRRRLIFLIDRHTRVAVCVLAPSESSVAAGRAVIKFSRTFGLPRTIRTDHGAGFISQRMRVFLSGVGVEALELAPAYRGDRKPFVERFVRTLQEFLALAPGFAGHSVAQRAAIAGRLTMSERRGLSESDVLRVGLSDAALEDLIDRFLSDVYSHRAHAGLGGRAPADVFRDWQARGGVLRRPTDEQAMYSLLAERGRRTIGKRGLAIDGARYSCPELAAFPGREVEFRRLSPSRVAVFTLDDPASFIAIADDDVSLDSAERQARAIAAGEAYRALSRTVRGTARRLVAQLPGNPAEILVGVKDRAGRVAAKALPITTPAIEEARRALAAAEALPTSLPRANLVALQPAA